MCVCVCVCVCVCIHTHITNFHIHIVQLDNYQFFPPTDAQLNSLKTILNLR